MAYISLADADIMLTSSEWTALSDTQKNHALDIGAKWIDAEYSCTTTDPVQDEVQTANGYLADLYAKGTLFTPNAGDVESVMVKAGPVSVSEKYAPSDLTEDAFAEIHLLLSSTTCLRSTSFVVKRV